MHYTEFAQKIKAKYPEYQNYNDKELAMQVSNENPKYKGKISFDDRNDIDVNIEPQAVQKVEGFGKTAIDSLMFGTSPYVAGGMAEASNIVKNILRPSGTSIKDLINPFKGYGTKFEPARQRQIKDLKEYRGNNPKMALIADLVGGAVVPVGGGAKAGITALKNAGSIKNLIKSGAAAGSIYGGLYGLGSGISQNENKAVDLESGIANGIAGAGIGAGAGAVLTPVAGYVAKLFNKPVSKVTSKEIKAFEQLVKADPQGVQKAIETGTPYIDIANIPGQKLLKNARITSDKADNHITPYIENKYATQKADSNSIYDMISEKNPHTLQKKYEETGKKINERYYKQFENEGDLGKRADFSGLLKEKSVQQIIRSIRTTNERKWKNIPDTDFRMLERLKHALDERAKQDKNYFAKSKEQDVAADYRELLYELTDKMDEALSGRYKKANKMKHMTFVADELLDKAAVWEKNPQKFYDDYAEMVSKLGKKRADDIFKSIMAQDFKNRVGGTRGITRQNLMSAGYNDNKVAEMQHIMGKDNPFFKKADSQMKAFDNYGKIIGGSDTAENMQRGVISPILEGLKNRPSNVFRPNFWVKHGINALERKMSPLEEMAELSVNPKYMSKINELYNSANKPKPAVQPKQNSLQKVYEQKTKDVNPKLYEISEHDELRAWKHIENAKALGQVYKGYKGKAAIDKLMETKNGYVPDAFYRKELGTIDLVYGDKEVGLKHIETRRAEQNINIKDFLSDLADVIETGVIYFNDKTGRYEISKNKKVAIIDFVMGKEGAKLLVSAFRGRGHKIAK